MTIHQNELIGFVNVVFEKKIERDLDICEVGHESIFSYVDMQKEVKKKSTSLNNHYFNN